MPRLLAAAVCLWLGVAIVCLALWIGGLGAGRDWYWTAVGITACAILFALNAVNAEALVVKRNIAHAQATGRFDSSELGELGDDAVPALEAELNALPRDARASILADVCRDPVAQPGGFWAYNGTRDGAAEARRRLCAERTP
jgi:hypothetical protein